MKKTITILLLLAVFGTLLVNCEKEQVIIDDNSQLNVEAEVKFKKVTIDYLQQKEVLGEKLEVISSAFDIEKNDFKKKSGITANDDSFTVLTDEILEILTDSTEAYSFKIQTPTDINSAFENFVIEKIDDDYRYWIYRYTKEEEINDDNETFPYTFKRQAVNEEQINTNSFKNFLKNAIHYDEESGCIYMVGPGSVLSRNDTVLWARCNNDKGHEDDEGDDWLDDVDHEDNTDNQGDPHTGNNDDQHEGTSSTSNPSSHVGVVVDDNILFSPEYFDDQIFIDDEFKDEPCLKDVYDNLGKASKIREYLNNFDEKFTNPVANLRLLVGQHPIYPDATAVTDEPVDYLIKITFNPDKLNRPKLDIARTMIHEIIHAEMYRKLLSVAQQPNIPWTTEFIHSLRNNYEGLADYYTRYWLNLPPNQSPTNPQHEQMAEHFRGIIEQALRDFDDSLSDLQYEAIAWVGLKGGSPLDKDTGLPSNPTAAWKEVPKTKRLLLNSIYEDFINDNPDCK